MTRIITILTATVLVVSGPAVFGQTSAQAGGQASGSASAQASQSGAQASTGASASASSKQGKQGEQEGSLAAGTALNAQLNQSLDSKKCKAGDPVVAHTTEPVKSEGKTVLPKGTKLAGHVTRASARSNGDADSALGVQFDRAILKDGREIPLQASIQALAAAQTVAAVGGDDLQSAAGAGAGAGAGGSGGASGRGVVGGTGTMVGGAASGAASTVPRTVVGATGGVGSTVGATTNSLGRAGTGLSATGELTSTSRGVFGLDGLKLNGGEASSTEGSLITSAGKNVHLDSGTRMLVVTQAASSALAQR